MHPCKPKEKLKTKKKYKSQEKHLLEKRKQLFKDLDKLQKSKIDKYTEYLSKYKIIHTKIVDIDNVVIKT